MRKILDLIFYKDILYSMKRNAFHHYRRNLCAETGTDCVKSAYQMLIVLMRNAVAKESITRQLKLYLSEITVILTHIE